MALKKCKECDNDVSSKAESCPKCGAVLKKKRKKTSSFTYVVLCFFLIVAMYAYKDGEDKKKDEETLKHLPTSLVADISPVGQLGEVFSLPSDYTDLQRDKIVKDIKGETVQWTLPVYDVRKVGTSYRIQTEARFAIGGATPMVGAIVTIYPRNKEETSYIENLKTGDWFQFKGVINGTSMRHIDVRPAILILK